jgi:heptosyltransferase-2
MAEQKRVSFAVKAPNWLGDAVLAIPAVRAVVRCARRGRLLVVASKLTAEVFTRMDGVLAFGVTTAGGGPLASARAAVTGARVIRRFSPVMIFSLTRSATSSLMCRLSGAPRRVGAADSSLAFLYTDRVQFQAGRGTHLSDWYRGIVESTGIEVRDQSVLLEPTPGDLDAARRLMSATGLAEGGYVCMFPGATYGPAKRWPGERFALLGDMIADRLGLRTALLGAAGDLRQCRAVEERMANRTVNLCGRLGFPELMGLLRLSRSVVANDSGGMHLAAAVGVPVVGLFFSTDPRWTGPISPNSRVLYNPIDCSPCFARDCDRNAICTRSITPQEVMDSLERKPGN